MGVRAFSFFPKQHLKGFRNTLKGNNNFSVYIPILIFGIKAVHMAKVAPHNHLT